MNFKIAVLVVLFSAVASAAAPVAEVKCPISGGESEDAKPALTVQTATGRSLIVCGYVEKSQPNDFSEFSVYSVDKAGTLSKPLFVADAFHSFTVLSAGGGLDLTETTQIGGASRPLFKSRISCSKESCEASRETCVFKSKKLKSTKALKEFNSYVTGANKGKVPDETVVSGLFDVALSGSKKAQKTFMHPPDALKLDAAPGEEFDHDRALITRLKEAHCL